MRQGNVRPENDTCPLPILIALTHHWMIGILTGVCVCVLSPTLSLSFSADPADTSHKQTSLSSCYM